MKVQLDHPFLRETNDLFQERAQCANHTTASSAMEDTVREYTASTVSIYTSVTLDSERKRKREREREKERERKRERAKLYISFQSAPLMAVS